MLNTARALIKNEQLGADEVPDLLAINFSSNDYVGHKYGSASAEVLDITVQLDQQLGSFFTWLDEHVGLNHVLTILTSDHGACPTPQNMRDGGHFESGLVSDRAVEAEFNRQLTNWFGLRDGRTNAARVIEYNLYVHTDALRTELPAAQIHRQLAEYAVRAKHLGFYAAYTREEITRGELPRTDICERVMKGFHPENSGDIILVPKPYWVHVDPKYPYITSHGSPYAYDTAVPLLISGPGIRRVKWLAPISTMDIAPTLAYLLGTLQPSGSEGRILGEIISAAATQ